MEIYIAGRFGYLLKTDVWSSRFVTSMLSARERRTAEQIVARHGQPSVEALAAARAALGADGELDDKPGNAKENWRDPMVMGPTALSGFCLVAFLSAAAAFLFRGGLLMRAFGIAVVRRDGSDASGWRMLWRACLAWVWLPISAALTAFLNSSGYSQYSIAIVGLPLLGLVIWSAANRGRSLPDRLAGTWLVPR